MTGNDRTPDKGLLGSWLPTWPAGPSWLYWVTQGVHVTLGLVLIPIVLAKLWSVLPKLFEWPLARSITHLVERASLLLLDCSPYSPAGPAGCWCRARCQHSPASPERP